MGVRSEISGAPVAGSLMLSIGPVGAVSFDFQLKPPFAIEAIVGGGGFPRIEHGFFHTGVGARFRFMDNKEGYPEEPGGDTAGNFFLAAHVGYMLFDKSEFGIDASVGYEWSVHRPLQVGVFARGLVGIRGAGREIDAIVTSPLRRTRETAQIISDRLGHPVAVEEGLAEAAFGTWDGLTFVEVRQRFPDDLDAWLGSMDVAPGGGESLTTSSESSSGS